MIYDLPKLKCKFYAETEISEIIEFDYTTHNSKTFG